MSWLPKYEMQSLWLWAYSGCMVADRAAEQCVKPFFLLKSLSDEMEIFFLLICVDVGLLKKLTTG